MIKNIQNAPEWSDDIGINCLPFYIYIKTLDVEPDFTFYDDVFERVYDNFLRKMDLNGGNKYKEWCRMQAIHYYECNH